MKQAADACATLIADMERGAIPYWLTLAGTQGAGKTMLATQTFAETKRCNPGDYRNNPIWVTGSGVHDENNRRPRCVWFDAHGFKDRMMSGEYDLPEYLRPDYCVVIDDLGASRDTGNQALADGLYRLANLRMHRWMIWTTNLSLKDISDKLDARIASRLIRDENRLVAITAPDYALAKRRAAL